jgi:DNA-binding NarL/FixJ family response regulator
LDISPPLDARAHFRKSLEVGGNGITVIVADDHPIMRSALIRSLRYRGYVVVGDADDGEQAVVLATKFRPDLAILDLVMPGIAIVAASATTRVVVYTGAADAALGEHANAAGAAAVVSKAHPGASLYTTLATVVPIPAPGYERGGEELSAREREVVVLTADGYDRSQVAAWLGVSPKTVDNHRANAMKKLRVAGIAQLARCAERRGLVGAPLDD